MMACDVLVTYETIHQWCRKFGQAFAPVLVPNVTMLTVGPRELRVAVVLPTGYTASGSPLPVLVDSYGGPDGQRVLAAQDKSLPRQWFAEHGFAVVVADGRGTRGRSPAWSREIKGDVASLMLQDQVDALHGAAEALGCLDLSRVGIRGLSFAGYLAFLAVLRRPDVFHVAVAAGAPTDMRFYETHWMERYLGHPDVNAENYDSCSLVNEAHRLSRPLMLIHGCWTTTCSARTRFGCRSRSSPRSAHIPSCPCLPVTT